MSEHIDIDHELIAIRHYLHTHPERSFQEFDTSIYLTDQLKAHGIEILPNSMETGVVGLIQGEAGPGPRIGARGHRRLAHCGGFRVGIQLRQQRRDARLRP